MSDEKILVVNSIDVPNLGNTFVAPRDLRLNNILKKGIYIDRSVAENNSGYKQIIPYAVFRFNEYIFYYKRSMGGGESRLHNLFSIGVGGHINLGDIEGEQFNISVIENARDREIKEEFEFSLYSKPALLGFVNDDTNLVGKLHLGVVYELLLRNDKVKPLEASKVAEFGFKTVSDICSSIENFETWSQIILQKHYCNLAR